MPSPDHRAALAVPVITLKVGSALLVDEKGLVREAWLATLADDLKRLRERGSQIIVVTSGAIALGRRILGLRKRNLKLDDKQAAAATGQIALAGAWRDSLERHGIKTAQLLITPDDTENRRRYLNAKATLNRLLQLGVVPVVNENDTVATSEIRFGDNDRLSARVAIMAGAETLVLLSDVDGLYTADPSCDPNATHIPVVDRIDAEIEAMAGVSQSDVGTGGMTSKLQAAQMASRAGTDVILCAGSSPHPLLALEEGARLTHFRSQGTPLGARKQWIGASLRAAGTITVDAGAARALLRGASLLPAGVTHIEGAFERGDAVNIVDAQGRKLAKGLSSYDFADAEKIKGRRSAELGEALGWQGRDALVHRDNLVIL